MRRFRVSTQMNFDENTTAGIAKRMIHNRDTQAYLLTDVQ